jgi:hypothetical protein
VAPLEDGASHKALGPLGALRARMQFGRLLVIALFLSAGCLAATEPLAPNAAAPSPEELARLIGEPIEQLHDHTDPSLHTASFGLEFVNWSPLIPEELGTEGFAGLRIIENYGYLATDGAHAGFLVVDLTDPRAPTLVSQYSTPGGASQEAVPSWDGNWVFLNLQRQPGALDLVSAPERGTGTGIQIIDVSDKANPRFESFVPVEILGSHVMFYTEFGGKKYLVYNGQPLRQGLPTGDVYTPPLGNVVKIAEFTEVGGVHTLVTVGEFLLPQSLTAMVSQGCFPHDQWVEEHPLTGQMVMYVAYWDCGAVTVDVTDPTNPVLLDVEDTMAPSTRNRIHFYRPDPLARQVGGEERIVAWSGPEIDLSPGEPGYVRAYDVTDPTDVSQIGHWRLPGEVENDKPFLMTPHNFDYHGDLMALAHYHAGVWVLDVSDPTNPHAVAYYLPHGDHEHGYDGPTVWRKTPNFPEAYFPNVYEAKWFTSPTDGETYLLVSERGSGLYVLKLSDA